METSTLVEEKQVGKSSSYSGVSWLLLFQRCLSQWPHTESSAHSWKECWFLWQCIGQWTLGKLRLPPQVPQAGSVVHPATPPSDLHCLWLTPLEALFLPRQGHLLSHGFAYHLPPPGSCFSDSHERVKLTTLYGRCLPESLEGNVKFQWLFPPEAKHLALV